MSKFEESNFYKALQDFFINADKKTFLQFLTEFYNRTEGIIGKNDIQDDLIKELRELYLEFNEKGIDENVVREKVNYFLENSLKIKDINSKLDTNIHEIKQITNPYFNDEPIITFIDDDGTQGFLSNLKSTFDANRIKVSLGIITSFVGTGSYMTLEQLKTLENEGHDILSHSKTHSKNIFSTSLSTITESQLDVEFGESLKFLKDNGFKNYDLGVIYPHGNFGDYAKFIKKVARKYYKFGVNAVGNYNDSPSDSMYLDRVFLNKNTDISIIKEKIDNVLNKKGWLIFGTHSALSSEINGAYLQQVINYINEKNIKILKFSEAYKLKGNILSIGDFTEPNSFQLGYNGRTNIQMPIADFIINGDNTTSINKNIGMYEKNKFVVEKVNKTYDTLYGKGGKTITYNGEAYYRDQFYIRADGIVLYRVWNEGNSSWNTFSELNGTSSATTISTTVLELTNIYTGFTLSTSRENNLILTNNTVIGTVSIDSGSNTTLANGNRIFKLPTGARPLKPIFIKAIVVTNAGLFTDGYFAINTNGDVTCQSEISNIKWIIFNINFSVYNI